MGAPTANKKMRCSILFLSLAIIYASASPVDEVVPEESLYALDDDLSEARSTIEQMTTAGKSDKDCRKLVEETRKEVQTNVDTCTKTMDALPKGEACPAKGQAVVKAATEAKSKADKLVITTKTAVTKAESASVSFGSRTFSSLTEGKCESFYTSTSYTTAEATYKSTVTAYTKATGAASEAAIALKNAVAAAAKEKAECECAVKKDHESKFSTLSKANAANEKAWSFACKVECVLDGKTTCKCSAAPKCVRPKVTSAVMEAVCVAKKVKDEVINGVAQCGAKSNYVVLYSGPNCTGKKWTVKKDTNFCHVSGMNDNVDSIQGCGPNVHILHHCDAKSATIWKNDGASFAKCQNLSTAAKAKGPSYVTFK